MVARRIGPRQGRSSWRIGVYLLAAVLAITGVMASPLALWWWGEDSRPGFGAAALDERLRRHRPDAWW
jgi:hypothetical protein